MNSTCTKVNTEWALNFGNLFCFIEHFSNCKPSGIFDCLDAFFGTYKLDYNFDAGNYSKMKSCQRKMYYWVYTEKDRLIPVLCDHLFNDNDIATNFMNSLYHFCSNIKDIEQSTLNNLDIYQSSKDIQKFLSSLFDIANKTPHYKFSLIANKINISDLYADTNVNKKDYLPRDYIRPTEEYKKIMNYVESNNITFVYGLSGSGKTTVVRDIFNNLNTNNKFWLSSRQRPEILTLNCIFNELLKIFECRNLNSLTFKEKESTLFKFLESGYIFVLDDFEKSPEKEILFKWVLKSVDKLRNIKFIITSQTNYTSICNDTIYFENSAFINAIKVSGLDKIQTTALIKERVESTEHLKILLENSDTYLALLSNKIWDMTKGNPQVIKSYIAYIEDIITMGNSFESILNDNKQILSVNNIFSFIWNNSLDETTKKVISSVALMPKALLASDISLITKLPIPQENELLSKDFVLGKALSRAVGSSMVELKIKHTTSMIKYTKHSLVEIFIKELLTSNKCPIVTEIYANIQNVYS